MENKEIKTAEQWIKERGLTDVIISHPSAGEQYQLSVSDALRLYLKECTEMKKSAIIADVKDNPTPATSELNLDERANYFGEHDNLIKKLANNQLIKEFSCHLINELKARGKDVYYDAIRFITSDYTGNDSAHHNHASFVALVEGEIAENVIYIEAMKAQGTAGDQGVLFRLKYNEKLTDLLNKIK